MHTGCKWMWAVVLSFFVATVLLLTCEGLGDRLGIPTYSLTDILVTYTFINFSLTDITGNHTKGLDPNEDRPAEDSHTDVGHTGGLQIDTLHIGTTATDAYRNSLEDGATENTVNQYIPSDAVETDQELSRLLAAEYGSKIKSDKEKEQEAADLGVDFEVQIDENAPITSIKASVESNGISTSTVLYHTKVVPIGNLLIDKYKYANLKNGTTEDRAALDKLWHDIESVLPPDVAQRHDFGDLVTYQRLLTHEAGRPDIKARLNPDLSVEYTVEANFWPSTSYREGCSSKVSGYTDYLHLSIRESITNCSLSVVPGGTKFLVQATTLLDNSSSIVQDCRVFDGGDGQYSADCTVIQGTHVLSRMLSVEIMHPLYLGYYSYPLHGTIFNVGNNVPLRHVIVEQNINLPTFPAIPRTCVAKSLSDCDAEWLKQWNGSALVQTFNGQQMTRYIPLSQCQYDNLNDTLASNFQLFLARYEAVRILGASHLEFWTGIADYVTHNPQQHRNTGWTRFHYLETLNFALEWVLDPSLSAWNAPHFADEKYDFKKGPMFATQDLEGNTLCILQVGAWNMAFKSMQGTFELMVKSMTLLNKVAMLYPSTTFVMLSTASYPLPLNRNLSGPRYKAEKHRHFRKISNTGALSQYMKLHIRAMALPNVHFIDYQSISNAFKYDGEWEHNHFGKVWSEKGKHPVYSSQFPEIVGQAPLEVFTMLVQGLRSAG